MFVDTGISDRKELLWYSRLYTLRTIVSYTFVSVRVPEASERKSRMGIEENAARFLLYAKQQGVSYDRTAMLGRQGLFLNSRQLRRSFSVFNESLDAPEVDQLLFGDGRFSEAFFRKIGANSIESFDNSEFEKATHIHDFNQVIPEQFKDRYTAIFDGGTLEHVFNFPQAIKNCMEMVEVGGHFLSVAPANNFFGHGFYQFSPELFFRVFSKENGYQVINLIAAENFVKPKWYAVKDPDTIKSRVILANRRQVFLLLLAKRIEKVPIFTKTPQQSDYVAKWVKSEDSDDRDDPSEMPLHERIYRKLPPTLRNAALRTYLQFQYGFNKRFFVRFDPTKGQPYPR